MASKLFNPPLQQFPSGYGAEEQNYIVPTVSNTMKDSVDRRNANRALIHDAFPAQGNEQRSHEGSQSTVPTKEFP